MKLWQLSSIAREERETDLITQKASSRAKWKKYVDIMRNYDDFVMKQDRGVLDMIVDNDFVEAVLGAMRVKLYLSSDDWLRPMRKEASDQELSVLESYKRYGANAVEESFEYGTIYVGKDQSTRYPGSPRVSISMDGHHEVNE